MFHLKQAPDYGSLDTSVSLRIGGPLGEPSLTLQTGRFQEAGHAPGWLLVVVDGCCVEHCRSSIWVSSLPPMGDH